MENQWSETATHARTHTVSLVLSSFHCLFLSFSPPPLSLSLSLSLSSLLNDLALGTVDEDSLRREPFLPFLNKRGFGPALPS